MNKRIILTFFLAIITTGASHLACALPETKLPIFNGFWYTDAKSSNEDLPCNPMWSGFKYTNKVISIDVAEQDFISSLPAHNPNECKWQKPDIDEIAPAIPIDYPASEIDWNSTPADQPRSTLISDACLDSSGLPHDSKSIEYYPSYTCPKGTLVEQYSGSDNQHCYEYKDVACAGDVIGRNMETSVGILASEGHVGITIGNALYGNNDSDLSSVVIQVLNTSPVINIGQSLTDFKNTVPEGYWGAKYGVNGYENITVSQSEKMLALAQAQKLFNPTYTPFWNSTPGGPYHKYYLEPDTSTWKNKIITANARFRCDFFVYFLYKFGADIEIPYNLYMTPQSLYDSMQSTRPAEPVSQFYKAKKLTINRNNITDDLESEIESQISSKNPDINILDSLTNQYLTTNEYTRNEKLLFLYNLMTEYQNSNSTIFCYISDALTYLKPTENAEELISLYNSIEDNDEKASLIYLLNSSIFYDTLNETKALTQDQINGIISIENFLKKEFYTTDNKELLNLLAIDSFNIADKNDAEVIYNKIEKNPNISQNTKYIIVIQNQNNEQQYLLNNYSHYSKNKQFQNILRGYNLLLRLQIKNLPKHNQDN